MSILLKDGIKYLPYDYKDEDELEGMVIEHYKEIFGENSIFFMKRKIKTLSGMGSIPDGFVFDLEKNDWYILEIELSSHDPYKHITPQITKFNRSYLNPNNVKTLRESFYKNINDEPEKKIMFELKRIKEIHKFITDLIDTEPKIVIIIDNITQDLIDVSQSLPFETINREFKTYVRENADISVHIHFFEPITEVKPKSNKGQIPDKPTNKTYIRKGEDYSGKKIKAFYLKNKRYEVKYWLDVILKICDLMRVSHKKDFEKVLTVRGTKRPYFAKNSKEIRIPMKIENTDVYIETNLSSNQILRISLKVLSLFSYSKEDFEIETN